MDILIKQKLLTLSIILTKKRNRDPVVGPAPFTYFVWQRGIFHPFPLSVGILSPLKFIIMLLILFKLFDICVT